VFNVKKYIKKCFTLMKKYLRFTFMKGIFRTHYFFQG